MTAMVGTEAIPVMSGCRRCRLLYMGLFSIFLVWDGAHLRKPATKQPDGQITSDYRKHCQAPRVKIFLFYRTKNQGISLRIPSHQEGRFANVTNAGRGCGGRGGARDGRCRSVRPSRMVLTPPTKVSSLRSFPQATVAIEQGSPGRSRSNRKTTAQGKSDVSAGPVCSCAFLPLYLHTRPRVPARIRLSLRPLTGKGVTLKSKTRAHRAAR